MASIIRQGLSVLSFAAIILRAIFDKIPGSD